MIAILNMDKPKVCMDDYYCGSCPMDRIWCMQRFAPKGYTVGMAYDDMQGKIPEWCPIIEIVRCGECMYQHEHEWYNTCDKHIGHGFPSDYFCGDGERRTDGDI